MPLSGICQSQPLVAAAAAAAASSSVQFSSQSSVVNRDCYEPFGPPKSYDDPTLPPSLTSTGSASAEALLNLHAARIEEEVNAARQINRAQASAQATMEINRIKIAKRKTIPTIASLEVLAASKRLKAGLSASSTAMQSQLTGITMTSAAAHQLLVKQDESIAHAEAAAEIRRQQLDAYGSSCDGSSSNMIDHENNEEDDDDDEDDSSGRGRRKRRSCRFIDDEAADAGDEEDE